MKLIKRLNNLWLLSNFRITKNDKGEVNVFVNNENETFNIQEKPRMAQIIKRSTPTAEFLKDEPQNEPT